MCMSVQQLAWKCLHNTLVLWNLFLSLSLSPVKLIHDSPAHVSPCPTLVTALQQGMCWRSLHTFTPPLWSDSPGLIMPHYVSKVISLWTAVLIMHQEAIPIHLGSGVKALRINQNHEARLHFCTSWSTVHTLLLKINGFRMKIKSKYDAVDHKKIFKNFSHTVKSPLFI